MEQEQDSQDSEQSTQQEEISTPPNQIPQVPQESPSISSDGRSLYLQVLGEKNREIERLQSQLAQKQEAPLPVVTPEQNSKFFESPATATQELIRRELDIALAPLKDFVGTFKKTDAYSQLKDTYRNDPFLGKHLVENEQYVDQIMKNIDPTQANLQAAIVQVIGLKGLGALPNNGNPPSQAPVVINNPQATPINPNPISMQNPPHLRPSAPAAPKDTPTAYKKPLDENERRLMRELEMTEEEYREGQKEGSLIIEPETTPKTPRNKPKESA